MGTGGLERSNDTPAAQNWTPGLEIAYCLFHDSKLFLRTLQNHELMDSDSETGYGPGLATISLSVLISFCHLHYNPYSSPALSKLRQSDSVSLEFGA